MMYIRKFDLFFALIALFSLLALSSCESNNNGGNFEPSGNIKPDVIVSKDGDGDFTSLQAAIDQVPDNQKEYFVIFLKKGTYKEVVTIPHSKNNIYLLGEEAKNTVVTYDNFAKRLNKDGKEYGTSGSASVFVNGDNFVAENLTFENTAGMTAGQALAINIQGKYSAFKNCRFLGHQDTWFANNDTYQYLLDCYIEGSVDFIFGGSTAYFEKCAINSTRDGYITAASTPQEQNYGYVFDNCKLSGNSEVAENSVYLGRPWRPFAHVVFLNCEMDSHIRLVGWHNWGNPDNEKTAIYKEYNTRGGEVGDRVDWSYQLSKEEAEQYSYDRVIGGKHPEFLKQEVSIME